MNPSGGPGAGGATLSPPPAPPGPALRAVALTPAVRGYPGGIADMAAEQDDFAAGGSSDSTGSGAGEPGAGVPDGAGRPKAARAVPGVSVWQRSLAAWQEAGIDWLRPARLAPSPEDRAAAEADLQHTQPIPAVPALELADQPGGGVRAVAAASETAGVTADAVTAEVVTADAVTADAVVDDAVVGGAVAGEPAADEAVASKDVIAPGEAGAAAAASSAETGQPVAGTASVAAASVAADSPAPATGSVAADTTAAGTQTGSSAAAGKTGRARPGKRVVIVAAATGLVLLAGAIGGVAIARSGPTRPPFGLVTPYPAAALADGEFAAPAAGPGVLPSLTGLAGAGKTIVAVGSQGTGPLSGPLILVSQNGGRAWARATLGNSNAAVGPGAVPRLIVRGRNNWLALGQHWAWTSVDGRVWQAAPGLPMSAGDRILGLARTHSGFIAVGENVPSPPGGVVPSPVLWTSADGQAWQRKSGAALTLGGRGKLDAGGGTMLSLRWAAYRASTLIVGGEISRPVVRHRGKRKTITNVVSPGLWRSRNDGHTWQPVKLPASHRATTGLAGLAATESAFVAVRPGRTATGRRDAVAYVSGTGSTWRYAARLTSGRQAQLRVLTVAASGQAFVVSGTTGAANVAFVSPRGWGWRKTADQGAAASTTVTGVTVASGSVVVTAGSRKPPGSPAAEASPFLLLTGKPAGRTMVGTAVLAAARTGDVTVNSLAATGGEQVAAGSTNQGPALWSATAAGHWVPSTVSIPASWTPGSLTSVVHGHAGWLAVGNAGPSVPPAPLAQPAPPPQPARAGRPAPSAGVVVTSTDGRIWLPGVTAQPLTAPGTTLSQAAAGPSGYVVVGSAATPGGRPQAAAWYSAGLSTWTRATITQPGQAGTGGPITAVTADRSGFLAVGSLAGAPAVWTSRTGSAWQPARLSLPAGAVSAVLTQVASSGGRVVATGDASRTAGPNVAGLVPFAAVSGDGGRTWREVVLHAPAGQSTVTALTAAGRGFAATGLSGMAGNQAMLAWWSPDGLRWRGGEPVAGPLHGRGVQQITALSAAGGALTGTGYAVTQTGEHPVRWRARYR